MLHVLFAVEIVIALAMVGVILLQQSEGGALGMGGPGGGGGFGGFLSARGAANLLTRATAFLATAFIGVALLLAIVAGNKDDGSSVFDAPGAETPATETQPATDDLNAPIKLEDEEDSLDTPPPTEEKDDGAGKE